MEKLQVEFTGAGEVSGWGFKQVASNGYAFIYEVKQPMVDETYYEVFTRRINGVTGNEEYPPRKAFGVDAFCRIDYEKAQELYKKLSQRAKDKQDAAFAD